MNSQESRERNPHEGHLPLAYASPELRKPRRSLLAISSLFAAILVLPAGVGLAQALGHFLTANRADLLGFGGFAVMAIGVLCLSAVPLRRIRKSSGAPIGRPIALVAFAISLFYLVPICLAFYFDSDLRWK